jgi:hypothetical protein
VLAQMHYYAPQDVGVVILSILQSSGTGMSYSENRGRRHARALFAPPQLYMYEGSLCDLLVRASTFHSSPVFVFSDCDNCNGVVKVF